MSPFNIVFNILLFSAGIAMLAERRVDRRRRKSRIVATIAGFLLFLRSVEIPRPSSTRSTFGGVTTPIAMIIAGVMLATLPPGR